MLKTALFAMIFLTGCSELKIIGNAAMNEMRADAVSTEWLAYNTKEEAPVMYAQRQPQTGPSIPLPPGLQKQAVTRKGLWEKY